MSFFKAVGICAGYGQKEIIDNIDFSLERGKILGILGANGCGKTTLLKSICGILPHKGYCDLDGIRLETLPPKQLALLCSYIPQRSGISIDISVLDVVLMGVNPQLGLLQQPNKSMRESAMRALCTVGLQDKFDQNFQHLSEGQKQLCILARSLLSDCKLMLMDEPESALDFPHRHQVLDTLRTCCDRGNGSMILTLHDPNLALNYCDQLLLLAHGSVVGMLHPKTESLESMEQTLKAVYGPVNIVKCTTKKGSEQLVLLKEASE